jgi:AraC-like DNA-binding protein
MKTQTSFQTSFATIKRTPAQNVFLKQASDIINNRMQDPLFNVMVLSLEMGLSRSQLHRKLKSIIGLSASQFIRSHRLIRCIQLMEQGVSPLSEIAKQTGFNSVSYFRKCFIKAYGIIPSKFYLKRI